MGNKASGKNKKEEAEENEIKLPQTLMLTKL